MVFPVVMYGCESWTVKTAECRIIDSFELWKKVEPPSNQEREPSWFSFSRDSLIDLLTGFQGEILKIRTLIISLATKGKLFELCHWALVCLEASESSPILLEKTLESHLDCKKIQLVHPKGDQSWVFIRKTDVEAETPILWPPNAGKD